jgi:hypothetical protein
LIGQSGGSGVPQSYTPSHFFRAMAGSEPAPAGAPINAQAVASDMSLVLSKSSSLLGYQQYLTHTRNWKGEGAVPTAGFTRAIQAQAAGAVVDTQALTSAALRITNQFKQAGRLDGMLSSWVAVIQQGGPLRTADLVSDLENQPSIRQTLKDDGITDDIWNSLIANLKNIDATLSVQNGKLTAAITAPNQDKPRNVVLVPSSKGPPPTLSALLQQGKFERLSGLFQQTGGTGLYLLPGPDRDLEVADVILSGAVLSVQSIAGHSRGLQDTGIAKYAGSAPALIVAIVAVVVGAVAFGITLKYCDGGKSRSPGCVAAEIFAILGIFALAALLIAGVAKLLGATDSGCPVMYYNFATGTWDCEDAAGLPPTGPISH